MIGERVEIKLEDLECTVDNRLGTCPNPPAIGLVLCWPWISDPSKATILYMSVFSCREHIFDESATRYSMEIKSVLDEHDDLFFQFNDTRVSVRELYENAAPQRFKKELFVLREIVMQWIPIEEWIANTNGGKNAI